MKKILAIAWKDTILRFTGVTEWLFFLILPVVFTVILGGGTGSSIDNRIRLLVVDQANSPLSAELIATLNLSEAVRPDIWKLNKAETEFSQRRAASYLVIPPDFNLQALEQGVISLELYLQPNNVNATVAQRAIEAVTSRISSAVDIANNCVTSADAIRPFASATERQAYFAASLAAAQAEMSNAPMRVAAIQGSTPNQIEYNPRTNSSAGQLITWVFIPLIGISAMFAYERQKGTLRRLLITPTRKATYLLGTITGQVASALVQMLILIGFGILIMKLNWGNNLVGLGVMLVSSVLAAAALGTTLGTFVKTEAQASGLSIMLGMVMALLGGCWYPIEFFPQFVRTAVKILPTSWAMQGLLDLVLRGRGLVDILPEAGVLLGFAVVFFAVGVWRFKYE